jgi:nucleoside 2-deoxyribosyltransferase
MNKLNGHMIYLAGPIDLVKNENDYRGWRNELTGFLHSLNIGSLDPCDKPILGVNEDEKWRKKLATLRQNKQYDELSKEIKNIVTQDLHLVDLSSAIIAYFDLDTYTCGTICEISHAIQTKKVVICYCKQGKQNMPGWMFGLGHHEIFFDTIDEVKNYILQIDSDQPAPLTERWKFLDINKIFGIKE